MNILNQNVLEKMNNWAPVVLRVGIALVFLWFGTEQLLDTNSWVNMIPDTIVNLSGMSAETLVCINGIFEVIFGLALLVGFFTRLSALLLALHLVNIIFVVGYNSIGVRDFGLMMASFSIFLSGPDAWCLDKFLTKNQS